MKKNSPAASERLTRQQLIDGQHRIVSERDFDASKPLRAYDRCAIEEYHPLR